MEISENENTYYRLGKGETLKSVLALLKWIDTFQSKNRREIRELMRKYEDKVVWLSNRNAVKEVMWIKEIER